MRGSASGDAAAIGGAAVGVGQITFVLRDIARGGLAGLLTGFLLGIGGRVVMRLAAILVPSAQGLLTENGNRIGDMTLAGSVAVIAFGGMFASIFGATLWVTVAPWIPGTWPVRSILAAPIAIALTAIGLIEGDNPDFIVLRHDPVVVALLLGLVGLGGVTISAVDAWLDRRLPAAGQGRVIDAIYLVLTVAGVVFFLPAAINGYLQRDGLLALSIAGVGVATLVLWSVRYRGLPVSNELRWGGRALLLIAVLVGGSLLVAELRQALGLG